MNLPAAELRGIRGMGSIIIPPPPPYQVRGRLCPLPQGARGYGLPRSRASRNLLIEKSEEMFVTVYIRQTHGGCFPPDTLYKTSFILNTMPVEIM
jgi:hypothetical protein